MSLRISSLCLALVVGSAQPNPIANPLSVVEFQSLRATLLTSTLVRIEVGSNSTWDDRATLQVVNRYLPPVNFTKVVLNASAVQISTADLTITYVESAASCVTQSGMHDDNLKRSPTFPNGTSAASIGACCAICQKDPFCGSYTFDTVDKGTNCWLLQGVSSPVPQANRSYGIGNAHAISVTFKAPGGGLTTWTPNTPDPLNLNGTYNALDCYTTPMQCNAVYDTRMGPGLLSASGWAALDDTTTARFVPAPSHPAGMPTWWSLDLIDHVDVYLNVFPSLDYRSALADWARVLGAPAIPPRSAFGVWWSRYYRYSQATIVSEVLQGYANYSIPLDRLVLDMDWHNEPTDKTCQSWGNYDVNTTLFPNMTGFMQSLHESGVVLSHPVELALNVHPQTGVDHCDSRYQAFAAILQFDTSQNATIPCDFGNATFIDALYSVYWDAMPLHDNDAWWTDYGGCGVSGGNPQLWNNRVVFDHMKYGRGIRGHAFSRYGGIGNHRYPHGFSGDTFQHEVSLYFQIKTTQTAANALFGYWSHDIGGFHTGQGCPGDSDPGNVTGSELLLRWIQWGAVAPLLRTHCDHCERRIWLFPHFSFMRDGMVLRNALSPYIYTAARAFYDAGVALVHPLYYDFDDSAVFGASVIEREYMFGDHILASPISTMTGTLAGSLAWPVYLPAGSWSNWNGTSTYVGPLATSESYGVGDIPLFVRGGGPLPLKTLDSVAVAFPDPLVWAIWPGAASGSYSLYEDDGVSDAYESGESVTTPASFTATASSSVTLVVSPIIVSGSLPPAFPSARGHVLQIRGCAQRSVAAVTANGIAVPPGAGTPGWYIVPAANHSLAQPEGSLVVNAGAAFAVDEPLTVYVTFQ